MPFSLSQPPEHLTCLSPRLQRRLLAPETTAPSAALFGTLKSLLDSAAAVPPEQKNNVWKLLARSPCQNRTARALIRRLRADGLGAVVLDIRQGFQFLRDERRVGGRGPVPRGRSAGRTCEFTGATGLGVGVGVGMGGYIIPAAMEGCHRAEHFWRLLEFFWEMEDVAALRELCGADGALAKSSANVLSLSKDAAEWWDRMACCIDPVWESMRDGEKRAYRVRVRWIGRQMNLMDHRNQGELLRQGTEFDLSTKNPEKFPLPDPALLHVRAVLAGAAVPRGALGVFSWHCEEEDGDEEESETGSDTDTGDDQEDDGLDGDCATDDDEDDRKDDAEEHGGDDDGDDDDGDAASDTEGMLHRWLGDQAKNHTLDDDERERVVVKELRVVRMSKPWSI